MNGGARRGGEKKRNSRGADKIRGAESGGSKKKEERRGDTNGEWR